MGRRRPASRSARPQGAHELVSAAWRSAPTASASSPRQWRQDGAGVGRRDRPADRLSRSRATRTRCTSVAFSPDGKRIVSGSLRTRRCRCGTPTPASRSARPQGAHGRGVRAWRSAPTASASSPAADDKTVRVWDADTGQQIGSPSRGTRDACHSVAFSPDGKRIVSGSRGQDGAGVGRRDRPADRRSRSRGTRTRCRAWRSAPTASASSPASWDKTVRVWDADTGKQIGDRSRGTRTCVAAWRSAPTASASSPAVWTRRCGCGTPTPASRSASRSRGTPTGVCSVAFSPDGKRIVSGSDDKTVRVWDADTGQRSAIRSPATRTRCPAWRSAPTAHRIVSGSDDKTVRVWDADTGQPIGDPLTGHTDAV